MSDPERHRESSFYTRIEQQLAGASIVDDGSMEFATIFNESQLIFIGDLNQAAFKDDARADIAYMAKFLTDHPDRHLDDLYHACSIVLDQMYAEFQVGPFSADLLRRIIFANRTEERVAFVAYVSGHRMFGSNQTKMNLQAMMLSSRWLDRQETKIWAAQTDRLLPDETGINLDDEDAIDSALQLFGIQEETVIAETVARSILREFLTIKLGLLYVELNIAEHPELPGISHDLVQSITWIPGNDPNPWQMNIDDIRVRALAIRWSEETFATIVAELQALKDEITNAFDDE